MSTLDEAYDFIAEHVTATEAQLTAMALYAAATHALPACVTFGRILFTSEKEESGKTLAMMVMLALSSNAQDTSGSLPALQSLMAAASNEPEKPAPTLFRDEISDVFGRSGLTGSNNPIAEYLRKGYKRGATRMWSVNRVDESYSIFTPFAMTGLRTAIPRDVRSRSIVITMTPATPRKYFNVRESEPYAAALGNALGSEVKAHYGEVAAFRGRGLHPKLINRKLEVWEPLLAVAYALGGRAWLTRAVAAFADLALDESDQTVLSPRQTVLQDLANAASAIGDDFVGGMRLVDELRRRDSSIYAGKSDSGLACLIRDTMPVPSDRRTMSDGSKVRGYCTADIVAAWREVMPENLADDAEPVSEENPFDDDVSGPGTRSDGPGTDDVFPGGPGGPGGPGTLAVAPTARRGTMSSGGNSDAQHSTSDRSLRSPGESP